MSTATPRLDVTSSGATAIFTSTLAIGDCKLSIVGGQNAPGSVQINGAVSLTGVAQSTFNVENNNVFTLYGSVSGNAGLNKIGSGTLVLGNYNNYTGGTTINGGLLVFSSTGTYGGLGAVPAGANNISVNSGGALAVTGPYSTVNGWINSNHLAFASAGVLALPNGVNDSTGVSMASYPNLYIGASGNATFSGSLTPAGARRISSAAGAASSPTRRRSAAAAP